MSLPFKDYDYPELYSKTLYRAVNGLRLGYKHQSVNAVYCREIIAVGSEIHTEHVNTRVLCGQIAEFCNVKTWWYIEHTGL
jgi:hypothetical protein